MEEESVLDELIMEPVMESTMIMNEDANLNFSTNCSGLVCSAVSYCEITL